MVIFLYNLIIFICIRKVCLAYVVFVFDLNNSVIKRLMCRSYFHEMIPPSLFYRIVLYREEPCSKFEDHGQVVLPTYVKRAIYISGVHQKPFPKYRNHDTIT